MVFVYILSCFTRPTPEFQEDTHNQESLPARHFQKDFFEPLLTPVPRSHILATFKNKICYAI